MYFSNYNTYLILTLAFHTCIIQIKGHPQSYFEPFYACIYDLNGALQAKTPTCHLLELHLPIFISLTSHSPAISHPQSQNAPHPDSESLLRDFRLPRHNPEHLLLLQMLRR